MSNGCWIHNVHVDDVDDDDDEEYMVLTLNVYTYININQGACGDGGAVAAVGDGAVDTNHDVDNIWNMIVTVLWMIMLVSKRSWGCIGWWRTCQVLTDKVAAKPQDRVLEPLQEKPIIVMPQLSQSEIKKQVVQWGLERSQKQTVLDPKMQGVPLMLGDGGFWRWSPLNKPGKRIRYVCVHGKRKETCKECGGSAICVHNHHRRFCKQCQGGSLCWHGVQKSRCTQCKHKTNDRKWVNVCWNIRHSGYAVGAGASWPLFSPRQLQQPGNAACRNTTRNASGP